MRPSVASTSSPATGAPLVVGERVIVVQAGHKIPGILKFAGETQFAEGEWMGVELDEPYGKNNGDVKGMTYFDCKPGPSNGTKHGLFVRRSALEREPKKSASSSGLKRGVSKKLRDPSVEPPQAASPTPSTAKPGEASAASSPATTPPGHARISVAFPASDPKAGSKLSPRPDASAASPQRPAPVRKMVSKTLQPGAGTSQAGAAKLSARSADGLKHSATMPVDNNGGHHEEEASLAYSKRPAPQDVDARRRAHDDEMRSAQQELAEASEEHDADRIRAALLRAQAAGVKQEELSSAQRVLNFEVQKSLLMEVEGVRDQVARLAESVEAAEAKADAAEKRLSVRSAPGDHGWLSSLSQRLERQVWEGLERRMEAAISDAVARATRELLEAATEVGRLRGEASSRGAASSVASAQSPVADVRASIFRGRAALNSALCMEESDELEEAQLCADASGAPSAQSSLADARASVFRGRAALDAALCVDEPADEPEEAELDGDGSRPLSPISPLSQRQEAARATIRMSLFSASSRFVAPSDGEEIEMDQLGGRSSSCAVPGVYGERSRRWRRAARRVMRFRFTASALSKREGGFTAASAVGALEASLAEDEEFERIMSQWGQKGSKRGSVAQAFPDAQPLGGSGADRIRPGDAVVAPPRQRTGRASVLASSTLPTVAESEPLRPALAPVRAPAPQVPSLVSDSIRNQARASVALALSGAQRLSILRSLESTQDGSEPPKAPRAARQEVRASISMLMQSSTLAQKVAAKEAQENPVQQVNRSVAKSVVGFARQSLFAAASLKVKELESSDAPLAEARSAVDDIDACMRRMEAARASTVQRVDAATAKIQACYRGMQGRREASERAEGVVKLQQVFRRMQANRKATQGTDFYRVAMLLRRRNKAFVDTFLEATRRGGNDGEEGLDRSAFIDAVTMLHTRLSFLQAEALWTGFQDGVKSGNMGLRIFCGICEAVSTGDSEASEYADISLEQWLAKGSGSQDAVSSTSVVAFVDALKEPSAGELSRDIAQGAVQAARDRLVSSSTGADERAAAAQLGHWEAFFRQGMDETDFVTTLRSVRPTPSKAHLSAIWQTRARCTGGAPLDFAEFAMIAEAVVTDAHAAAEFADLPVESYLMLGADGAEAAAAKVQAIYRGNKTRQTIRQEEAMTTWRSKMESWSQATPQRGSLSTQQAATHIQASFRGHAVRQTIRQQEVAATSLQAAFRGQQQRQEVRQQQAAAVQIQAAFRQRQSQL